MCSTRTSSTVTLAAVTKIEAWGYAPDDDPTVIPVPTAPDRIKQRRRLDGLLNECRPAT
jgi:hypothetical protein